MSQRDRILLSVIGGVILLGGFWMLILKPKRNESTKLSTEIAATRQKVEQAKAAETENKTSDIDFSKTYATLAKLGKAVPVAGSVDDDVPSLLLQLNQGGKVTRTGFARFEVNAGDDSGDGSSAAAGAQAPAETGSEPATGATGAAGAAAPSLTLNKVSYKYSFVGSLYNLEDLMNYVTNLVDVEGQRLTISGRLIAIEKFEFTIVSASNDNPLLKTDVDFVTYTTPEGEGIAGGAAGATPAAATDGSAASGAAEGGTPGAPPQAQPATPPSASVKRP